MRLIAAVLAAFAVAAHAQQKEIKIGFVYDVSGPFAGGGSEAAQIDTAFGGNAAYLAAVGTSNPMTRAASFQGVPVKLWYSTDDPSVPTAHVASFATAAGAPTASLGAVGHSAGSLTAEALTSFFAPYL
jgi:alpha-beta hydrolase superfamily lysophospholipase